MPSILLDNADKRDRSVPRSIRSLNKKYAGKFKFRLRRRLLLIEDCSYVKSYREDAWYNWVTPELLVIGEELIKMKDKLEDLKTYYSTDYNADAG